MQDFNQHSFSNFIFELLSDYECLVIPGFGGFVCHYEAAKFDESKGVIHPPSRSVSFNALLHKNDGLLVQELSRKLRISYSESGKIVQEFISEWKDEIEIKGVFSLNGLGEFTKRESSDKLIFSEQLSNNLLSSSYGLIPVKAQLIAKDGISGRIKEEYVSRQASPVFNQKVRRTLTYALSSAAVILAISWTMINLNIVQQKSELLSVFFHQHYKSSDELIANPVAEVLTENAENKGLQDSVSISEVRIEDSLKDELFTADSEIDNENEDELIDTGKQKAEIDNTEVVYSINGGEEIHTDANDKGRYIIVAGCFQSLENAKEFIKELNDLGYDAHFSGKSASGLNRVAYESFNKRVDALKSLAKIRLNHNPQAWVTRR